MFTSSHSRTLSIGSPLLGRYLHIWVRSIALLAIFASSAGVFAQDKQSTPSMGGSLDAKTLGDRILVPIHLKTGVFQKHTYAVIDIGNRFALQLSQPVFQSLAFAEGETALQILNEGFRLEIDRAEIIQERGPLTVQLSSRYDNELQQVDVSVIIGWPALKDFAIEWDPMEEKLTLHSPVEMTREWLQSNATHIIEGVTRVEDSIFVPVNQSTGKPSFMKFETAGYHTYIGRESGTDANVFWGSRDLLSISEMVALYAKDFVSEWEADYETALEEQKANEEIARAQNVELPAEFLAHKPDYPEGDVTLVAGLGLLSAYRLHLNHHEGILGLTSVVNSNYSHADAQFYAAATAQDISLLRKYLEENPKDRNVEEAVSICFDLSLEENPEAGGILALLDYGLAIHEERRKFQYLLDFLGKVANADTERFTDLIIAIGEKALTFVSRTQAPALRQQTQLALGDRYLAKGDADMAMRYILAAAFNGDPRLDGVVRHELGRVYEAQGRVRRAYANYQRSLSEFVQLPQDMSASAQAALDRLKPQLDPDDELLQAQREGS